METYFTKKGLMKKGIKRKLEEINSLLSWYKANEYRLPFLYSYFGGTCESEINVSSEDISTIYNVSTWDDIKADSKINLGCQISWINEGEQILDLSSKYALYELESFLYNIRYIKRAILKLQKEYGLITKQEQEQVSDLMTELSVITREISTVPSPFMLYTLGLKHIELNNGISIYLTFTYSIKAIELNLFYRGFTPMKNSEIIDFVKGKISNSIKHLSVEYNYTNRIQ
jgi:hypothetical protein